MTSSRRDEPLPWVEGADEPDYVVLPPDPEAIENERRLCQEQIAEWEDRARREPTWAPPGGTPIQFRFSLKDLFVVTAVIAIALSGARLFGGGFSGIVFFALCVLVWIHARILLAERAEARAKAAERGQSPPITEIPWKEYAREIASYSVADLLVATTVIAVVLAIHQWVGPFFAAGILSFWVFGGAVAFWLGMRPSKRWWLVWTLVTVAYIVYTMIAAVRE